MNNKNEDAKKRLAEIARQAGKKKPGRFDNKYIKGAIAFVALAATAKAAYCIDVYIRPVTSNISVFAIKQEGDDVSFRFGMTKYRQCDFVAMKWYTRTTATQFGPIKISFKDNQPGDDLTLPEGRILSSVLMAHNISEDDLRFNTFVVFRHKCHPLWYHERTVY